MALSVTGADEPSEESSIYNDING
uniref:Uncharacterized protein n=1 Tax=Moniliophthora roreri TaxID=221103 RepID=A0A0W0F746_MONRR